jgi:hypothetical protein
MKWLVVLLFAAACLSSLGWYEARERNFNGAQKIGLAIAAVASWALVLVLGTTAV